MTISSKEYSDIGDIGGDASFRIYQYAWGINLQATYVEIKNKVHKNTVIISQYTLLYRL